MANVLVLCTRPPVPATDGAKLRVFNTAKALSGRHDVDVLVVQNEAGEDGLSRLDHVADRVITFSHSDAQFYRNVVRGIASRKPIRAHYYAFEDVDRWLDRHVERYDLVYANYLNTTEYARERGVPRVADLVDAMSHNYLQRARRATEENFLKRGLYALEGRQLGRYERSVLASFDHGFLSTAADARRMTGDDPPRDVTVLPNGVRDELLSRPIDGTGSHADAVGHRLVFLGRMDYFPNEDASRYFASEVFPHVRRRHPEAEFLVVGAHPSERVRALDRLPNVHVTGFVESVPDHLARADVVVAPMRFGTGIQNKVLEAMALGKGVVTTPLGAEGIDGTSGTHFVVAGGAPEFAGAVTSLLGSPDRRRELGENARELIEARYTWEAVGPVLLDAVERVLADGRSGDRGGRSRYSSERVELER